MKRRGFVGLLGALGLVGPEKLNPTPVTMQSRPGMVAETAGVVENEIDGGGWHLAAEGRKAHKLKLKAWELFAKNDLDRRARKRYAAALMGGRHPHTVGTRSWAPWFTANVDARKFQADEAKDRSHIEKGMLQWWSADDEHKPYF